MKKRLLDLILMLIMIVGLLMFFIGMLQFNDGFKNEVGAAPAFFYISLIGGLVLMIGSMIVERKLRIKSPDDSNKKSDQ